MSSDTKNLNYTGRGFCCHFMVEDVEYEIANAVNGPGSLPYQHSRIVYKCSFCHAVLTESCIVDWVTVTEKE